MLKVLSFLLLAGVVCGCAYQASNERHPSSVSDIGIIGPKGEVILYYKEGDFIVFRQCDPNTILGVNPSQARKNCTGQEMKVPVESFKQSLRLLVTPERLNILRPLTPEDVEDFMKEGPTPEQVQKLELELERINNFIRVYGAANANLVRKEEVLKALQSNQARTRALRKVSSEIEKAIELITNSSILTLKKASTDKDQFLYTVLKQYLPNQKIPCGLQGTIEERIKDCSLRSYSPEKGFQLVTRTLEFKEIHRQVSTGLLWTDVIAGEWTFEKATYLNTCSSYYLHSNETGGISGINWKLPSIKDYKQADIDGIRSVLPRMQEEYPGSTLANYFLTSDLNLKKQEQYKTWWYYGGDGSFVSISRFDYGARIRCVGR